MAKKTNSPTLHTCDDCAHGTFDMQQKNLSITGKPTLIICPFQKYKIVVGTQTVCGEFRQRK